MRSALACLLFLVVCGSARADVFVPADPPMLARANCVAGAGDVIAAAQQRDGLFVRTGGGAWQPFFDLFDCPTVAVASDGTAAITASELDPVGSALSVRRPGGTFGAPITLGPAYQEPAVAAAPGGWVVSAWTDRGKELVVLVVRPDGSTVRAVLDQVADRPAAADYVGGAQVGIDAAGNTTVLWQRVTTRATRARVARGTAGGAPVPGPDLPGTGSEPDPDFEPADQASGASASGLSVAPGGTTLIAWTTQDGVRAMLDGGPPVLVDSTSYDATTVAAAVADDGTALLAYARSSSEIVAVDRAGGTWGAPRVLSAALPRDGDSYDRSDYSGITLAAIAPGGRAVAVWGMSDRDEPQVFAAVGQAGGSWGTAQRLSSITRTSWPAGLSPDGSHVSWTEDGLGVRGATLAPAPSDTVAPVVSGRLPARVPPTRTGRFTLRVNVTCSEACDAQLAIPGGDYSSSSVVRALAAGQPRTLKLRPSVPLIQELLRDPKARRLRPRLTVTDRAGNVVRQTGTLRVRVIEKPIRALKVPLTRKFGMRTAAGNRLVATLVNDMIDAIADGASDDSLRRRYMRGRTAIRRAGHKEISSSKVRRRIYDALEFPLSRAGRSEGYVLS